MLCKYYIKLGSTVIGESVDDACIDVTECIKNTDSIKVSYSRSSLGGVIRKCGSSIEFVSTAYDKILSYYEENYLQSTGVFAVFVADNNWNFKKLWDCPLDFSTLQYDGYVATMGCVDNSVAAVIKANGKSEYEFSVDSLADSANLLYNGVVTKRTFDFNVVGASPEGESTTDMIASKTVDVTRKGYYSLWIPAIGVSTESYSSEKFSVFDQSEDSAWDVTETGKNDGTLMKRLADNDRAGFIKCIVDGTVHIDMDLTFRFTAPDWAKARSINWYFILVVGDSVVYRLQVTDFTNIPVSIHGDFDMTAGQKMAFGMSMLSNRTNWMDTVLPDGSTNQNTYLIFTPPLRWPSNTNVAYVNESGSQSEPIELQVVKPITLLQALLDKMFKNWSEGYAMGEISDESTVLNNTMLLAAESVRKITTNKIYSKFNDFADFMESVFGFVYTVEYQGMLMDKELEAVRAEETQTIQHICVAELVNESMGPGTSGYYSMYPCGGIISEDLGDKIDYENTYNYDGTEHYNGDIIKYDDVHDVFLLYNEDEDKYYVNWNMTAFIFKSTMYNENGKSKDMLGVNLTGFDSATCLFGVVYRGSLIVCDALHGTTWLDEDVNTKEVTIVGFKHRSSVFSDTVIKKLDNSNNLNFSFDDSKVYSAIEVGYEKQDYDNSNSALNEFNFTNYYNTDTTLTDNTLSLLSPYRSDCYGIEELMTKSSDTESTKSDNDVFIVVCKKADDGRWNLDRDTEVKNAYTDTVFNAALAPNIIVRNNEAYIGSFAKKLTFTSSDGNSSAIIGDNAMNANIDIASQMFKVGKIAIDTGDTELPESWDGIIEFEYNGKTYQGYLDSVDINFAYMGTLTYNLIEKCIE